MLDVTKPKLLTMMGNYPNTQALKSGTVRSDLADLLAVFAQAAGATRFELVTTVPSSDRSRDELHPLRHIVAELVAPTRNRYQRLLRRTDVDVPARTFSEAKFHPTKPLQGHAVLLIDDTWTTGASAQSAAAALKQAGAGPTAAVVIGRHLNREWHQNDRRLRGISQPFKWADCALCAEPVAPPRRQT